MIGLEQVLERAIAGLGYQLADFDYSNRNRLLRVFIDKLDECSAGALSGVSLADCEAVTRQLQRLLPVEGFDYERLEVSSPGLDRRLRSAADFARFAGRRAHVRLRHPVDGRRNFLGVVHAVQGQRVEFDFDGGRLAFELADLDRANLVPEL